MKTWEGENAGIHGEGDDCLQATWPFGEASRIEMQEALSRKLMKNQAKRAAESEVDAEVQQRLRTDSADLLCNLAVVLLLQPWPTSLDLQRAYAFLKQSLEMDATMDSQHFLQRALRLLRFHELEPDDTPDTGADGETGETEQSRLSVGSNVTHATQVAARLQRENTMFPDTEVEERRCRQLQRIWLATPSGRWLCGFGSCCCHLVAALLWLAPEAPSFPGIEASLGLQSHAQLFAAGARPGG